MASLTPVKTASDYSHQASTEAPEPKLRSKRFLPPEDEILTEGTSLRNADKKYRYERRRNLAKYGQLLGTNFTNFYKSLKDLKDVKVLDSGAGKGLAMLELLQTVRSVNKCVCITKHNFLDPSEQTIHPKMEWFFTRSEDYLKKNSELFDMITDVFGAYSYSINRHELLWDYIHHLKIGGKAFIFLCSENYIENKIFISGSPVRFEDWLVKSFPDNFKLKLNPRVLVIKRKQAEIKIEKNFGLIVQNVSYIDKYPDADLNVAQKQELDMLQPCHVDFVFENFDEEESSSHSSVKFPEDLNRSDNSD